MVQSNPLFRLGATSLGIGLGIVMAGLPVPQMGDRSLSGAAVAQQAFQQQEVDQSKYIVLASPVGNDYKPLILEQVSDQRACWTESGTNPVLVDPLLLKFDFTGICGRSVDSNGYSIRMAGREFGPFYSLRVVPMGNDLTLVGVHIYDPKAAPIELGRTNGLPPKGQFAKFQLNSGWRLTRRTLGNKVLGHIYLTTDTLAAGTVISAGDFSDTQRHWARNYIKALAERSIITGFPDGSFRPEAPVTRVQFAVIVSKAFPFVSPSRPAPSFTDIPSTFWGLQPVQTAAQQGFISGYPDGTFKPNDSILRMQALLALAGGLKLTPTNPEALALFQDATEVPTYAKSAISASTERKIIVNYPKVNILNPNRPATRAEVAAFVYQALVDAGQVKAIESPYIAGNQ
ncbi:MAG: DUF3747 domain-containing protein [Leptolyngbyaceae cyanobacterium bins.59]|nr:DUF3747 domain-containing protein [Leptolyngbyaceae cyanobacterium bins.59]